MNTQFFDAPAIYCIAVLGALDTESPWQFGGLRLIPVPSESDCKLTLLVGRLSDQAALFGVLNLLYNLTIPIWSVQRLTTTRQEENWASG